MICKKKKPVLYKIMACILICVMLTGCLTACGGSLADDGVLGTYRGQGVSYSGLDLELDGEANYIELKKGGKAKVAIEGTTGSAKWSLGDDGTTFTLTFSGDDYSGKLSNGVLTVDIMGMIYTYVGENGAGASAGGDGTGADSDGSSDGYGSIEGGLLGSLKSLMNGGSPFYGTMSRPSGADVNATSTGKGESGYFVLESVKEPANSASGDELADYGLKGSYIYLENGAGYMVLMGTPEDIVFDKKAGVIHSAFGDIAAALKGGKLTLADESMTMVFASSKDSAPAKPGYPSVSVVDDVPNGEIDEGNISDDYGDDSLAQALEMMNDLDIDWDNFDWDSYDWDEDPYGINDIIEAAGFGDMIPEYGGYGGENATDLMDFWNDYWFGYWELDAYDDSWKQFEGYKFATLGQSVLEEDGTGGIFLWDNDYDVADVEFTNNGYGLTNLGTMISESGYFWDGDDIGHADWNVDPGLFDHKDYIRIDSTMYYDGERQFDYTIHLVKWGSRWDDFSEDELPDEYNWYIRMLDEGLKAPGDVRIEEE